MGSKESKGWKAEVPAGAERPFQLRYSVTLSARASSGDGTLIFSERRGPRLPSRKLTCGRNGIGEHCDHLIRGPHVGEYARHGLEFGVMRGPVNLGHAVAY